MYRDLPDFDTLMALHRENPEELERVRLELTSAILENTSGEARRRLEGLQFRINMELRRASTPEARCVKMSSMMHDAFAQLQEALQHPRTQCARQPRSGGAQVIAFPLHDSSRPH